MVMHQVNMGHITLVKHQDLGKESLPSQIQYLKDDTLYLKVTMTEIKSRSKPWLAGAMSF